MTIPTPSWSSNRTTTGNVVPVRSTRSPSGNEATSPSSARRRDDVASSLTLYPSGMTMSRMRSAEPSPAETVARVITIPRKLSSPCTDRKASSPERITVDVTPVVNSIRRIAWLLVSATQSTSSSTERPPGSENKGSGPSLHPCSPPNSVTALLVDGSTDLIFEL